MFFMSALSVHVYTLYSGTCPNSHLSPLCSHLWKVPIEAITFVHSIVVTCNAVKIAYSK